MLVIVILASGEFLAFGFGNDLDPELSTEDHVRRILAEYEERREEIWELDLPIARGTLLQILYAADESYPHLVPLLDTLSWFGKTEGWDHLEPFLRHPDDAVRLAAIRALGRMGMPAESQRILRPFLNDENVAFRRAAIVALGKLAADDLLPEMEEAAEGVPDLLKVLGEAKRRLRATKEMDIKMLLEAVIETDEYLDLVPLSMMIRKQIPLIVTDPARSPLARAHAVDIARLMDMRKLKTDIKELLIDEGNPVNLKVACALSLGRFRTETAVEPLIEALDAPDASLRRAAVKALGLIGDPAAGAPLLRMWDEDGGGFRPALRLALWRVSEKPDDGRLRELLEPGGEAEAPRIHLIDDRLELEREVSAGQLIPMLASETPEDRRDAAFLLGFCGRGADAARLKLLAEGEEDPAVREIALRAVDLLVARHSAEK